MNSQEEAHAQVEDERSELDSVGYFVFRTPNWEAWMNFATRLVRAHIDTQPDGTWARLRLDEKQQRVLLEQDVSTSFAVGLQARDEDGLDALARRLRAEGLTLTAGTDSECHRRGVRRFIWFNDPDGNRIEAFVDLAAVDAPLTPMLPIGGFRTQDLGAGHVVLMTPQFSLMSEFYRRVLRMSLTDFVRKKPFEAQFFRMNPRHHSVALLQGATAGIHHVMFEYLDWDDVGRAYDEALLTPKSIGQTLGRHSNDLMTSFYVYGPDRFMVELGWAGRLIGKDWKAEELIGPSLWGHERYWLPADRQEEARQVRAKYAQLGIREPVDISSQKRPI